jgi:hypothetical protein
MTMHVRQFTTALTVNSTQTKAGVAAVLKGMGAIPDKGNWLKLHDEPILLETFAETNYRQGLPWTYLRKQLDRLLPQGK